MENSESKKNSLSNKIADIIGTVVFFASFAPYFVLIYFGIAGINFGMQGIARFYGLIGIFIGAIVLFAVGALPVCVVLQAVLGKFHISSHPTLSRITKILYIAIIIMFVLTEPLYRIINKVKMSFAPQMITTYLEDKYGEEMAAEAEIVYDHGEMDETVRYYHVYTSVLPDDSFFVVSYEPTYNDPWQDDLMKRFVEANPEFTEECENYILEKSSVQDNIFLVSSYIQSIDFEDYQAGDDYRLLFDRTTLNISFITVYTNDSSEENIKSVVNEIFSNEYLKDQALKTKSTFCVCIKNEGATEEDKALANIYVDAAKNGGTPTARIYMASNKSGTPDWTFELS